MTRHKIEAKVYTGLVDITGAPMRVLTNPTASALISLWKREDTLRGLIVDTDVIWWPAHAAIHGTVAEQLGMGRRHEYIDGRLEAFSRQGQCYVDFSIWDAEKIPAFRKLFVSDDIQFYGGSFGAVSWSQYQEGLKRHPQFGADASVTARLRPLFHVHAMPKKVEPKDSAIPTAMQSFPKNDYCSLVAMSFALNVPIAKVWGKARSYWTKAGSKGLPVQDIVQIITEFGKSAGFVPEFKGQTMGAVMPKLGRLRGAYLVVVPGHILAVKDGKFADTMDTPSHVTVLGVFQVKALDRMIGKFVDGDHRQNGKLYRLSGIYYGDKQVYVRAVNGEGVLPLKNIKVRADDAPPALRDAYTAYRKKFQ